MHFGKHNAQLRYTLKDKSLVKVTEERDLGIVISGDLKVRVSAMLSGIF